MVAGYRDAVYAKGLTAPLMALLACSNCNASDIHALRGKLTYIYIGGLPIPLTGSCRTELSIQWKLSLVKAINIPGQLGGVK